MTYRMRRALLVAIVACSLQAQLRSEESPALDVKALQQQVAQLKAQLAARSSEIAQLRQEMAAINSSGASCNARLAAYEQQIAQGQQVDAQQAAKPADAPKTEKPAAAGEVKP